MNPFHVIDCRVKPGNDDWKKIGGPRAADPWVW